MDVVHGVVGGGGRGSGDTPLPAPTWRLRSEDTSFDEDLNPKSLSGRFENDGEDEGKHGLYPRGAMMDIQREQGSNETAVRQAEDRVSFLVFLGAFVCLREEREIGRESKGQRKTENESGRQRER